MPLQTGYTNETLMEDAHPAAHNDANNLTNQLQTLLALRSTEIADIQAELGSNPSGAAATVEARLGAADLSRALNGVGFVVHGSNAATARPNAGFGIYIWLGTVQPNNWANNDIYIDLAP